MLPHELIRAQRELGLMNYELAATLGVGRKIVSLWRGGHSPILGTTALAIRVLLDLPPEQREKYLKRRSRAIQFSTTNGRSRDVTRSAT